MSDFIGDRRQLLRSAAAWLLGGGAVATARPARAWEMQKLSPTSPLGITYANHCGGQTDHNWLIAQMKTQLASDPSLPSPLSETCPLCGCPVIVSR